MSVHGAPQRFPLPPSSAPSTRPSLTSPPSEQIIYSRNFLGETLKKLGLNEVVHLPTRSELGRDLSTGESIILPLLCSTINSLASLLERVDTRNDHITHTHDSISKVANSVPNRDELTASLAPITSAVRDLSHRVSTAPVSHRPTPHLVNQAQAPAPPPGKPRPPHTAYIPTYPDTTTPPTNTIATLRRSLSPTQPPGRPPISPMWATRPFLLSFLGYKTLPVPV